jgi:hypothetical protein
MAQDYQGILNVGYVRTNPDEHFIAATYAVD